MHDIYEVESNGWGLFVIGGLTFYGAQSLLVDAFRVFVKFILM